MATYSIRDLGRREILIMSAVLAGARVPLSPMLAAAEATLQRTPDQILGPFYPLSAVGCLGLGKRERPIDHGAQAVQRDGPVHHLKIRAAPDADRTEGNAAAGQQ